MCQNKEKTMKQVIFDQIFCAKQTKVNKTLENDPVLCETVDRSAVKHVLKPWVRPFGRHHLVFFLSQNDHSWMKGWSFRGLQPMTVSAALIMQNKLWYNYIKIHPHVVVIQSAVVPGCKHVYSCCKLWGSLVLDPAPSGHSRNCSFLALAPFFSLMKRKLWKQAANSQCTACKSVCFGHWRLRLLF